MTYFFNAEEVFHVAILIEQNGERFYQLLLDKTREEAVKNVCTRLRDDEKKHAATFQRLLGEAVTKKPAILSSGDFPEEEVKYLKSMADANVFGRRLSPEQIADKIKTEEETIRFAMNMEKESITFYAQIKKFVQPGPEKNDLDKIIQEEQEHYKALNKLLGNKVKS